jgi:hypothetical protein
MSRWDGLSAGTLKSMIRRIDNKIEYRSKQIRDGEKLIEDLSKERDELAEALNAAEGDSGDGE